MSKLKDFINSLRVEKDETIHAYNLVKNHIVKGDKLDSNGKEIVIKQFIDILKTLLIIVIFFLPFGSFILIGISFFSISKFIFPSAFSKKVEKKT